MSDVFDFDLSIDDLPESSTGSYDPAPEGVYTVRITDASVRANKGGAGCHLSLEVAIVGPTHEGRKIWPRVTIKNASERAEEIGRKQLRVLMQASGLTRLTADHVPNMIGTQVKAKVVIKDKPNGDGKTNDIAWYAMPDEVAQKPVTKAAPVKSFRDAHTPTINGEVPF